MKASNKQLFATLAALVLSWGGIAQANPNQELEQAIILFNQTQQQLVEERRALAEELQDKTPAERRAAIEQYQEENAERIAAHHALGEQIRQGRHGFRPNRDRVEPRPGNRPDHAQAVQDRIRDFQAQREELLERQHALREELKDATNEERQAAMELLREERRQIIEQQREWARNQREAMADLREERRENARDRD